MLRIGDIKWEASDLYPWTKPRDLKLFEGEFEDREGDYYPGRFTSLQGRHLWIFKQSKRQKDRYSITAKRLRPFDYLQLSERVSKELVALLRRFPSSFSPTPVCDELEQALFGVSHLLLKDLGNLQEIGYSSDRMKAAAMFTARGYSIIRSIKNDFAKAVEIGQSENKGGRPEEISNGKKRLPKPTASAQPTQELLLAKDFEQGHRSGFNSLTKRSLRRIRDAAIKRLKVVEQDMDVRRRAIAEDIFPTARKLFPDSIAAPSDVDGNALTNLFRAKAENPTENSEPLEQEKLEAIKLLAKRWRKHFTNVVLYGQPVTVSSAKKHGLEFRFADAKRKNVDTLDRWPRLEFPENKPEPC
ncbi:hypothetical protein [Roseimaritima sediminicola]|uniref:hypothetical protein n=1 Tax=Roseimaritima sediminicola TaxID=2662066 RepID=UPI001298537E|nr:hypothetical protein [Roseimaritima sediminicola]